MQFFNIMAIGTIFFYSYNFLTAACPPCVPIIFFFFTHRVFYKNISQIVLYQYI